MLQIRFLGTPEVGRDGQPLTEVTCSPILLSLLAFLVMNRSRPHARPVLAAMFWPDCPESRARRNLNNHLWRLRRTLEPDTALREIYLLSDNETVQFSASSGFWLDVAEFETGIANFTGSTKSVNQPNAAAAQALEAAVNLYRSDFLEGIYDEWTQAHRERLRERFLLALETLVKTYRANEVYVDALRAAQQLVRYEPFYEEAHYQLIQLYGLLGKPHEAHVQYRRYETIWRDDLSLAPSARMVAIYHQFNFGSALGSNRAEVRDLPLLKKVTEVLGSRSDAVSQVNDQAAGEDLLKQVFDYAQKRGRTLKAHSACLEALSYFTLALDALAALPESRARYQHELAVREDCDELYDFLSDWERRAPNLRLVEQLADKIGDPAVRAEVSTRQAWMEMQQGLYAAAIANLQQALHICRKIGDRRQEALAHRMLGIAYDEIADLKSALIHHSEALRLDEAYPDSIPNDLNNLASVEVTMGHYSAALDRLQRALTLTTSETALLTRAMIAGNIGNLLTKLGQFDAAAHCLGDALSLVRRTGDCETQCWLGARLARLYQFRRERDHALHIAHHYYQSARTAQSPRRIVELAELLAALYCDSEDGTHAIDWANQSNELAQTYGFWRYQLRGAMRVAQASLLLKQATQAFGWARKAVSAFEQRDQPLEEEAELYYTYAKSAEMVGHQELAAATLQHARTALLRQADLITDTHLRTSFLKNHFLSAAIFGSDTKQGTQPAALPRTIYY